MNYSKLNIGALAAIAFTALNGAAFAGPVEAKDKQVVEPPPPSLPKVDFLVNVEFANEYVTPRGMIVHDEDLTIEPLILGIVQVYQGTGTINSFKLIGGMWNDFTTNRISKHAPFGSSPKTNYTEIDPIFGISMGFAKYFTLDVTYTAFVEQVLSIGTSHHLETKVSFDDSTLLKAFALHPYVSFWYELSGKATDADVPQAVFGGSPTSGRHPQPGSSFYFDIGIDPSYTFTNLYGFKLEAPCRVLLPDSRFYGEYYGEASTVGLFELGAKGSVPLKFMPKNLGNWGVHLGYKYMNFVDNNLYHLNTFNAPGHPVRTTNQVYGGISVFF